MSRRSAIEEGRPWTSWPATVDVKNRLTLPDAVVSRVPWLQKGEPLRILGGRGPRGGLRLYPPHQRDKIENAIKDLADPATNLDMATLDLARWLGMTWEISLEAGGRLILPEAPRKLGLVPEARETGVVFAFREVLEIWKKEAWDRYSSEYGPGLHEQVIDND